MMNNLEICNITKKWDQFQLSNISLSLEEGYIMGLIGRNGAGKTTLIDCILGKNKYDSGNIRIAGYSLETDRKKALEEAAFILEPAPFAPMMTLNENVDFFSIFYKNWNQEDFLSRLKKYELNGNQKYSQLSKGMKIRFQLAFALAHKPKLLVMDEPTGGLDPVFRSEFLREVQKEVNNNMMSVVISTHLTTDLDKVADYIFMLDGGSEIFNMDKEQMQDSFPLLSGSIDDLQKIPSELCGRIRKSQGTFTTMLKNPKNFNKTPEIEDIFQLERTSIENIMYYLTKPIGFQETDYVSKSAGKEAVK